MCAPKAIPVVCISIRDAYQFLVDHYPLYQLRNNELAADHAGLNGPQKQIQRGIEAMQGATTNEPTPLASAGRAAVEQGVVDKKDFDHGFYLMGKISEKHDNAIDTLALAVTTARGDIGTLTTSMTTQQNNINTLTTSMITQQSNISDLTTAISTMKENLCSMAKATESKVDAMKEDLSSMTKASEDKVNALAKSSEDQVSVLTKAIQDMRHDHAEEMKDVLQKLQQAMNIPAGQGRTFNRWTKQEENILLAAYHKHKNKNGRLNRVAMLQELQQTLGKHRSDKSVFVKLYKVRNTAGVSREVSTSSTTKDSTAGMSRQDPPLSTAGDPTAGMSRQALARAAMPLETVQKADSWRIEGADCYARQTLGHWVKAYFSIDGYYYDAKIIEILPPDLDPKPDQEHPDRSCMTPRFKIAWEDEDNRDVIKDLDDIVWQKQITGVGITKTTYRVQFACSDGQLAWTPMLMQEEMLSPHVLQRFQLNQSSAGSAAQGTPNAEFPPCKIQRTMPSLTLQDPLFTVDQLSPRSKANYDAMVQSGVRSAKALVACSKAGYANMHREHK